MNGTPPQLVAAGQAWRSGRGISHIDAEARRFLAVAYRTHVDVSLERRLDLGSSPPGIKVRVNGRLLGTTPLVAIVPPGAMTKTAAPATLYVTVEKSLRDGNAATAAATWRSLIEQFPDRPIANLAR